MNKETLLVNARWDIIQQVAQAPRTATEIAHGADTSLPNVSQQLRLLEAYDLVQRKKDGKQRKYSLKKDVCSLTLAEQGFADKLFFHPSTFQHLLLRLFFVPAEDQAFLLKVLLTNEEILEKCSVAHVKNSTDGVEVVFLTDDVDDIRKKYSNIEVTHLGEKKKLIAWTHTVQEINEGLERKDKHFEHLMKAPKILHDPTQKFLEVIR